jgi:hypothetical protein
VLIRWTRDSETKVRIIRGSLRGESSMTRILRAALVSVLALTVSAAGQPPPAARTVRGTVHAVEPKTGAVEVVTGVGMALRLVRLQTLPTTEIMGGGAGVAQTELKRGDVVRAECRWTDKGLVADRIEKVAIR